MVSFYNINYAVGIFTLVGSGSVVPVGLEFNSGGIAPEFGC